MAAVTHLAGEPNQHAKYLANVRKRNHWGGIPKPVLDRHGHRSQIGRELFRRRNVPVWGAELAEAVGLSLEHFWTAIEHCRWFTLVGKGCGWRLTREGLEEMWKRYGKRRGPNGRDAVMSWTGDAEKA